MIEFPDYNGPGLINNDLPKLIPITPFTARIKSGKSNDHRIQIPLRLIWVLTIHKCQGLTLGRAVIDLGKKERAGQTFVALSRLKKLENGYVIPFQKKKYDKIDKDHIRLNLKLT